VPELAAFHHVALTVPDLDATATWYQEVLGLEELFREEADARRAIVYRFAGGTHAAVGLVWHDGATGRFDPRVVGLDHLSFAVPQRGDLDVWAQHLDAHGISHSGAVDVPPGAILNFCDPNGVALAIFWDR
jgi:glyoxylase I family protein